MNLIDSSAWLEYFTDGDNAARFSKPIQDTAKLLVPTICLYEVFKFIVKQRGEETGLKFVIAMQQGIVVDLTSEIALQATKISLEYKLAMADSTILATARLYNATLWTQDKDFASIPGIQYFPKSSLPLITN
jgi:predicted nucleic acid-binding protein